MIKQRMNGDSDYFDNISVRVAIFSVLLIQSNIPEKKRKERGGGGEEECVSTFVSSLPPNIISSLNLFFYIPLCGLM